MPRMLLAGAFGQENPGDEALLTAFLTHLPDWDVVATSRDPATTAARHGCGAVHPDQRWKVARALRSVDAVVVGGGTVFKRLRGEGGRATLGLLAGTAGLAAAARASRRPVALVGVGAGDLSGAGARRLARTAVRMSDLLILRDEESAAVLRACGVPSPFRIGADPAWVLWGDEPAPAGDRRGGPVVVALSRHAASPGAQPALARHLAGGLRGQVDAGVPVELQPWQVEDMPLARAVLHALPRGSARIVTPPSTLRQARDDFTGARAVVGLRFHALVAAAAACTPFVAFAHEPKLAAVARRFGQPVVARLPQLAQLHALIESSLEAPPAHSTARAEAARAEEMFRLLHLLLSGGEDDDLATLAGLTLADGVPAP